MYKKKAIKYMIFIAHRGNTCGINREKENTIEYIKGALNKGYNVEIDVWYIKNKFYLGHDKPLNIIETSFLNNNSRLWIHAKNTEALFHLNFISNCFFHNTDDAVLTSKNYIWVYPGKTLVPDCISVLPNESTPIKDLIYCYAICSDNVDFWSRKF